MMPIGDSPAPQTQSRAMKNIKLADGNRRFGVVRVFHDDGTFSRAYRIPQSEVDELNASADGKPSGCTAEEWQSGNVKVYGGCLEAGSWQLKPDGSLRVCVEVSEKSGDVVSTIVELDADEFTGNPANANATDKLRGTTISVVDGVLIWR